MINKLLKNWDIVRIIRLILGIGVGIYATISKDYMFLLLAGLFIMQSILNISCCGVGGCSTADKKTEKQFYKDQIGEYKK